MPCHRCQNRMFPINLQDEAGALVHQADTAWRCFACGNIVDPLIHLNRSRPPEPEGDPHRRGARLRIGLRAAA
jgi:hypothetical protein